MNGMETRIFNMMTVHGRKREPDLSWMDLHKLKAYRDADSDPTDTGSSSIIGSGSHVAMCRAESNVMHRSASEVSGSQGEPVGVTRWQSRSGAGAAIGQGPTGVATATLTRSGAENASDQHPIVVAPATVVGSNASTTRSMSTPSTPATPASPYRALGSAGDSES